jgi:WD40 repeat protein
MFLASITSMLNAEGKLKSELNIQIGHSDLIFSLAFSPDGRYAVSGSQDHTLKLWDISTGKEIRTFLGHSSTIKSVAFSPKL